MKPGFEQYKPQRGEETLQLNIRVTPEVRERLELIAAGDGDPKGKKAWASLAYEGLGRVIEDRFNDEEWLRQASQRCAEEEQRHRDFITFIDSIPPNISPPEFLDWLKERRRLSTSQITAQ